MNAPIHRDSFVALSTEEVTCTDCKGRGYFWSDAGPAPRREDCDECGGSGIVFEEIEI